MPPLLHGNRVDSPVSFVGRRVAGVAQLSSGGSSDILFPINSK